MLLQHTDVSFTRTSFVRLVCFSPDKDSTWSHTPRAASPTRDPSKTRSVDSSGADTRTIGGQILEWRRVRPERPTQLLLQRSFGSSQQHTDPTRPGCDDQAHQWPP
jgi:hypothetical protein